MVPKFPKDRVVGPLLNGLFMAYKWGVANHLPTWMILQSSVFEEMLGKQNPKIETKPFGTSFELTKIVVAAIARGLHYNVGPWAPTSCK